MEFYTEIKDCKVYGLSNKENIPNLDIDCFSTKCTINWEMNFNNVISGLDSITVNVKRVYVEYEWEVEKIWTTYEEQEVLREVGGQDSGSAISGKGTFDTKDLKDFKIENLCSFLHNGEYFFRSCEIYLDENLITLRS